MKGPPITIPSMQLRQTKLYLPQAEGRFWEAVHILDYNFLFIPIAFTLLRMWTSIVDIVFVYVQVKQSMTPLWLNLTFVYLAVSSSVFMSSDAVAYVARYDIQLHILITLSNAGHR